MLYSLCKEVFAIETIGERLSAVIKASGLTKTAFAPKVNVSQPFLSQVCSGTKIPSDRTISDICRVFGVDEIWLKTGVGEMFRPKSQKEELAEIFAQVLDSDDARARMVGAFSMLPEDAYPALERAILRIADRLRQK